MELLLTVLKFLEHKNLIRIFQDKRSIGLGDSWRESVDEAIDEASVAVCFLSPQYFASDFVMNHEVPRIQERQRSGRLKVLPILLKDSLWEIDTWWSELQILTDENGRPLVNGGGPDDRDRVQRYFVELARQIFRLLPDLPTPPEPPAPAPPGNGAASRRSSKSRASGNRRVRPGNSNGTKSAIIVPSQHHEERLFEELLAYLADSDGYTEARGTVSADSKSNERLPAERRENAQSQGNKEMMAHRGHVKHRLSFLTFFTYSLRVERIVEKVRSNKPVAIGSGTSSHYVMVCDVSGSMPTPVHCNETTRALADRPGVEVIVPSGALLGVHLLAPSLSHAAAAWQPWLTLPWELLLRNQVDGRIEPKDANKLDSLGATLFRSLFSGSRVQLVEDFFGARPPLAFGPSTAQTNTGSALKFNIEVLERSVADHLLGQVRVPVFRDVASNFDIGDNLIRAPFAVAIDSGDRSVLLDARVCDSATPFVPYNAIGNLRTGTLKNGWLNSGNTVEISEPYEDVWDAEILRGNSGRLRDLVHGPSAIYTSGSTRVSDAPVPSGPCAAGTINLRDVLFKMIASGRPILLHEPEADRTLKCNLVGDRSGNNIPDGGAIQDRSWPILLSESVQEVNIS